MNLTLGKNKRLKGKKVFELLFTEGKSKKIFPLKAVFLISNASHLEVKIGVSVPKRRFKLAIHRNKIKRQIKEAYRINQHKIHNTDKKLAVIFIYNTSQVVDYKKIEKSMIILIDFLNAALLADSEAM